MNQLVLIERYSPNSIFWSHMIRNKKMQNLSVEQIMDTYQGFEGELIVSYPIPECEVDLNIEIIKCKELNHSLNYSMFFLLSDLGVVSNSLKHETCQLGFDIGVCEEEKTVYSSIFNEVIFGYFDELIRYKDFLNKNLLFPDLHTAKKYLKEHSELSVAGKGVEDYEKFTIYEIRRPQLQKKVEGSKSILKA